MSKEGSENIDVLFQAKINAEIKQKLKEMNLDGEGRKLDTLKNEEGSGSLIELQAVNEGRVAQDEEDRVDQIQGQMVP